MILGLAGPIDARSDPASASPAPPEPASSAIGPPLSTNDPCTSLGAIVTRPTVTNSVCTVRPEHVLLETGYQNTRFGGGGNVTQYPQALVRVGTRLRGLEFDLTLPNAQRTTVGGSVASGDTDVAAGIKFALGAGPKFSYGLQAQLSAPTGSPAFTASGTQTTYGVNFAYALSPGFSLASTLSYQSLTTGTAGYPSFVPSLVATGALSPSDALFAEIAQFTHANGPASGTRTQYLIGADHDFGQRVQADVETALSPTADTGKYRYVGVGLSYYR